MIMPHVGDEYPTAGRHATHVATIDAIDNHGFQSWEEPTVAPTIRVRCSCGTRFETDLDEIVAARSAA